MPDQRQDVVIWMRPEQAAAGRPAERSRAEITAAAVALADAEGLEAVSMRRVAAALDTGAASLYRYVATRDDLLDLMADHAGGEYALAAPTGDWRADLLDVARQARHIMRRHPWLATLAVTRPVLGPNGVGLLEHILTVLDGHPASPAAKLEAFALLTALTAVFVQHERAAADPGARRTAAYLRHAAASGDHPRLAALLGESAEPPGDVPDRFEAVVVRTLAGVLG